MKTIENVMAASLLFALAGNAHGAASDAKGLAALYGEDDFVTIATGSEKAINKAPSVATVITADDIEAIGAGDLDEVLETVPGLHVSRYFTQYNPIYSIRGIYSITNPEVLVLVNGIPLTNLFHGDRNFIWGGMPVKAISRIEVIRGPGSALYGADAFSGVINIVTKKASDIDGTEVGGRIGSFGRRDAWWMYGGEHGGWDVSFVAETGTTDGASETIEADAQSGLDSLFSSMDAAYSPASLAPSQTNLGRDNMDMRFQMSRDRWAIRAGYQGRYNVESGAGGGGNLDPLGEYRSERINADLTYHDQNFAPDWDVTFQTSFLHTSQEFESPWRLLPPGADFSLIGGSAFPDGVIGGPEVRERHFRLGGSAFYTGFDKHRLRFGAGMEYGELYGADETKNFFVGSGGVLLALPSGLTDVSNDPSQVFLPEESRRVAYFFGQDEWGFAQDWELTFGLRYDDYSDFGDTVNPRLALVWQTDFDLTTKFLYGRAFRAPAFAELYNQNNPVALGNPNLQPETIDTVEVAWDYRPVADWRSAMSIYYYRMADIIELAPSSMVAGAQSYQNRGEQTGYGVELEGEWDVHRDLTLRGNLSLLRTEGQSGGDVGNVPRRQGYVRADWVFSPLWKLNAQVNWVADRKRASGDTRSAIGDYSTVDLTLRRDSERGGWGATFSIRNLFDENAREPGPSDGSIPNDLPLAGRSAYLGLEYRFE